MSVEQQDARRDTEANELIDALSRGAHGYPAVAGCVAVRGIPPHLGNQAKRYGSLKIAIAELGRLRAGVDALIETASIPLESANLAFDAIVVRLVAIVCEGIGRGYADVAYPKRLRSDVEFRERLHHCERARHKFLAHLDESAAQFSVGCALSEIGPAEIFYQYRRPMLAYSNDHHDIKIENARDIALVNWHSAREILERLLVELDRDVSECHARLLAELRSVPKPDLPEWQSLGPVRPVVEVASVQRPADSPQKSSRPH